MHNASNCGYAALGGTVADNRTGGGTEASGPLVTPNAYEPEDAKNLNMNNRGRGRPPRRRGFDDEFSFDRAPPGDMPQSRSAPAWPSSAGFGPEHDATVKWFNPEKGFGFVALSDGSGDAFLHANTLNQSGHQSVNPGATLRVRIGQGQKGRQVSEVLSVDNSTAQPAAPRSSFGGPRPFGGGGGGGYGGDRGGGGGFGGGAPRRGPPSGPSQEMQGTVKWYNATKGFGFVAPQDGGKDVFVHASALQRAGIMQLAEGQTITMDVVQGAKGPEATAIRTGD